MLLLTLVNINNLYLLLLPFSGTGVFDLRAHVHSAEVDKLLNLAEKSMDVSGVLMYNLAQALLDNQKVSCAFLYLVEIRELSQLFILL